MGSLPDESTIPISALQEKLRALVSYSTPALVSEIRRLAGLSNVALQREFELREHIHRLPVEILGEIFALGQQMEIEAYRTHEYEGQNYTIDGDEKDSQLSSHLIVAQVCVRWRNVVLQTGRLWRRVSIRDKEPWNWTRLCLERSGEAPLRIVIPWTENDEESSDAPGALKKRYSTESLNKVFKMLLPYASRWESLSLAVDTYEVMYGALQILAASTCPMLTELELSNHDDVGMGETFEPKEFSKTYDLFRPTPTSPEPTPLRRAIFWGVHVNWTANLFSSLTILTLAYHSEDVRPSAETFFGILENSKETLLTLVLECSGPQKGYDKESGWPEEPIFLPQLRLLKIAFLPPTYVQNIITTFEAPSLDQLIFDLGDEEHDTEDWNRVIEVLCTGAYKPETGFGMLSRINRRNVPLFPTIQSLKLSAFPASPTQLGILLYCHPLIRDFAINFNYLPQEFLFFLTASTTEILRTEDVMLPRWTPKELKQYMEEVRKPEWKGPAQYLLPKLKVFRAYQLESQDMVYLVETRRKAGLPLKQIHFSDGSSIRRKDRIWLKKNLEVFTEFEDTDDEDDDEEDDDDDEDEDEDEDMIDLIDDDEDDNDDDNDDDVDDQQAVADDGEVTADDDGEWVDEDAP